MYMKCTVSGSHVAECALSFLVATRRDSLGQGFAELPFCVSDNQLYLVGTSDTQRQCLGFQI
jgi:hypothetical protein